jgi:hypothetical protein
LQNVVENPGDDKYTKVKKGNKKVKEILVKYKAGQELLQKIGFSLQDDQYVMTGKVSVSYLKGIRLDMQGAYSAFQLENSKK